MRNSPNASAAEGTSPAISSPKSISTTARLIALATILLAHDPNTHRRALVAPGASAWCERCLSAGLWNRILRYSVKNRLLRRFWLLLEAVVLPGIVTHYWARKGKIESICRASIAQGVQRVVVLGAGFDTLALRLSPQFNEVEFIELDHPNTQSAKLACLGADALPRNLRFIAADLTQAAQWVDALKRAPKRTLIVAEGLVMYFTRAQVEQLICEIRRLDPVLVMSYMVQWPIGEIGFRRGAAKARDSRKWISLWLRWVQEPFRFALEETAAADWLSSLDMQLLEHLRAPLSIEDWSTLRGENVLVARHKD
jgi:methyltransferase (TIGR00027 family)